MSADNAAPASIDEVQSLLRRQGYVADRSLAVPMFLALKLERPLFLEGEAGVGKTEIARSLASGLDTELIRLQCYEGLDVSHAVYEWNYARQLLEIRLMEAGDGDRQDSGPEPVHRALPDQASRCCRPSTATGLRPRCCSSTSWTGPTRSSRGFS